MKLVYLFTGLGLVFIVFQSFRSLSAAKIENQKYRVVKIEEGFCRGNVVFHQYVKLDKSEIKK